MNLGSSLELGAELADPDLTLVQEFASGRTEALDRLYEKYASQVYNACLGMLGNPDDARDAMQDTFVQVCRSVAGFRYESRFSTWLYRIAIRKCTDTLRRRPRWNSSPGEHAGETRDRHDRLLEARVREAILKLPPQFRAVLVLRYFQQLSYQKIAKSLECSLDQARIWLHRARKAFRLVYEEGDGGDEV